MVESAQIRQRSECPRQTRNIFIDSWTRQARDRLRSSGTAANTGRARTPRRTKGRVALHGMARSPAPQFLSGPRSWSLRGGPWSPLQRCAQLRISAPRPNKPSYAGGGGTRQSLKRAAPATYWGYGTRKATKMLAVCKQFSRSEFEFELSWTNSPGPFAGTESRQLTPDQAHLPQSRPRPSPYRRLGMPQGCLDHCF